jgi:hypothetical protein
MLRYKFRLIALFLLAILMFLHGSYFCVSPWAGGGPLPSETKNANP